jgi:hypothetical protein
VGFLNGLLNPLQAVCCCLHFFRIYSSFFEQLRVFLQTFS